MTSANTQSTFDNTLAQWAGALAESLRLAGFSLLQASQSGCIVERNGKQLGVSLALGIQSSVRSPAQTEYRVEAFAMHLLPRGARRLHMNDADILAHLVRGPRNEAQVYESLATAVTRACPAALAQQMLRHCD